MPSLNQTREELYEVNRRRVLQAFNEDTLNPRDIPFFLEEFAKGNIEVSPGKLPKVAALIGQLDKEEANDFKLSGTKANFLVKRKMARNAIALKKDSEHLAMVKSDHDAAIWAERLRLVGRPNNAANQEKLSNIVQTLRDEVATLQSSGNSWLHPFKTLRRKRKEALLEQIDIDARDRKLNNELAELQAKLSSATGLKKLRYQAAVKDKLRELNPREFYRGRNSEKMIEASGRKDLEQDKQSTALKIGALKVELNRNNDEYSLTKKQRKAKEKELREAIKLEALIDNRLKIVNAAYNTRCDKINKDYEVREALMESSLLDRCDIIRNRQRVLDNSTERGQYLEALLKVAPKNNRKELEEIANGRTEENVVDDAEFRDYLRDKGFREEDLEQLKLHVDDHRVRLGHRRSGREEGQEPPAGRQGGGEKPEEEQITPPSQPENALVMAEEQEAEPQKDIDLSWILDDKEKLGSALDGYEMVDNSQEDNLSLTFKKDERELNVQKESSGYVSVTAKAENGDKFPTVNEFRAIVRTYDNPEIALGPIQDDEYKARLMIAIELEGKKIANLDKEKDLSRNMKKLSPETRAQLEALEQQNGRTDAPVTLGQEMPQPKKPEKDKTKEEKNADKPEKQHRLNLAQLEILDKNQALGNLSDEQRKNLTWENLEAGQQQLLKEEKQGLHDVMRQEALFLSELRGTLKDQNSVLGSSLSNLRKLENQDEAVNATVQKLEMADKVVNMNDEEYQKFKDSEEYKNFGSEQERSLIDNARSFHRDQEKFKQEKGDGKDAKEAKSLGRMLSFYRGTKDNPDKLKKVIARELNPNLKNKARSGGRE